ncbi:integrase, partial [archaeon SCG-AAA382B04]
HKEIKQLAEVTEKQRNRAMIWVGYESGARPGELLTLKIRNVEFDKYGAQIMVDGKTGERRIRLVESVPDLKNWLSMHLEKDDTDSWLWTSRKGGRLTYDGWYSVVKKVGRISEVKKKIYPHLLRHSRATHLAGEGLNESQLREIFGWKKGSTMPSVYVHLSGRDTDEAILDMYGIDVGRAEDQFEKSV